MIHSSKQLAALARAVNQAKLDGSTDTVLLHVASGLIDDLQITSMELETARRRIAELEQKNRQLQAVADAGNALKKAKTPWDKDQAMVALFAALDGKEPG
ncbi:MAG: hypothetical protein GTN69_10555 [Armatimonadetes bacterium]|nr:hypothetical protein [Armatimonadota bacterium]